jgi:hypothetical protein
MRNFSLALLFSLLASTAGAVTFMSQQQALASAFPASTTVARETVFLSKAQVASVTSSSGSPVKDELVIRYIARSGKTIVGFAYFDTHVVRTLPETVMFVVAPDGSISRTEILSFSEPTDYLPKRRWLDQLHGKKLNNDLSLRGAVRPITGASLSGTAIVAASRRVLAIHQAIEASRATNAIASGTR